MKRSFHSDLGLLGFTGQKRSIFHICYADAEKLEAARLEELQRKKEELEAEIAQNETDPDQVRYLGHTVVACYRVFHFHLKTTIDRSGQY